MISISVISPIYMQPDFSIVLKYSFKFIACKHSCKSCLAFLWHLKLVIPHHKCTVLPIVCRAEKLSVFSLFYKQYLNH